MLPGARSSGSVDPVIDALVALGRFDDALALADGQHPDLVKIAEIAAALARAGAVDRALALAERVLAQAPHQFFSGLRVAALFAAAHAFRAGREDRAELCVARAEATDPEDSKYHGEALVRGLRAVGRDATATARALAQHVDGTPRIVAQLYAAAGLDTEAAEMAREALGVEDDDGADYWAPLRLPAELARLLPAPEARAVLDGLTVTAATIPDAQKRASSLLAIAGAMHEFDPARAGAVLGDGFRAAWLGGRFS